MFGTAARAIGTGAVGTGAVGTLLSLPATMTDFDASDRYWKTNKHVSLPRYAFTERVIDIPFYDPHPRLTYLRSLVRLVWYLYWRVKLRVRIRLQPITG